jgi:endonuclease/exonuclease/phosphatase family metal-dependent hydrolase
MKIKLLNYNIQSLPWIKKNYDVFSKFVLKYDICCFQEAYPSFHWNQGRIWLIDFFSKNGYFYYYSSVKYSSFGLMNPHFIDSGLLTVSRFPIINSYFGEYTQSSSVDILSNKGFLHNVIKLPKGDNISIINTHLQASYTIDEWPGKGLNQDARLSQFDELFNYISKLTGCCILSGDFNITTDTENYIFSKACDSLKLKNRITDNFDCVVSNYKIKRNTIPKEIHSFSDHLPMDITITLKPVIKA